MKYINAFITVTGLVVIMVALLALAGTASAYYTSTYEGDWLSPGGTSYTTTYYSWSTPYTYTYTPVYHWNYYPTYYPVNYPLTSWYYYDGYNSFDPWWRSNVYSGTYTYFWAY